MTTPTISYERAPSEKLLGLLKPREFLAPLIDLNKREVGGHEHDVHFRRDDEIHVYRGLTAVLTVRRLKSPDGCVRVGADDTYTKQPCAKRLFRRWCIGEDGFSEMIDAYLRCVKVKPSLTKGEGAVQAQWSRVTDPWIPFEREVELKYESKGHRKEAAELPEVKAAFDAIQAAARQGGWKEPEKGAEKIDQLAIDPKGRLVLIELKYASARAKVKVYYAPFQLLQYVWEWHSALKAVQGDLQKMIDARKRVGLTPQDVPDLTGGIRAVVGFGHDTPGGRTKPRYKKVLGIVNKYLPSGVGPIETWKYTDDGRPSPWRG